jgi:predicted ATPase/DNA-binding SARP family transcriptional activator
MRWKIRLFASLRAECEQRVVNRFRTQKTGLLLAYIAYYPGSHPREVLAELLWPDSDPTAARQNLNMAVSSLRRQLEPPGVPVGAVLLSDRFTLQLNPEAYSTDVALFQTALRQAARVNTVGERVRYLSEAVELYEGELLSGFYEEWCVTEREHVATAYLGALSQLIEHLAQLGRTDEAIQYARRAVAADPLREEAHQELIRLLAVTGQTAGAQRHFRELQRLLRRELDEEPSPATWALVRELGLESDGGAAGGGAALDLRRGIGRANEGEKGTAAGGRRSSPPPPTSRTLSYLLADLALPPSAGASAGAALPEALARAAKQCTAAHGGAPVEDPDPLYAAVFGTPGDALRCSLELCATYAALPKPASGGELRTALVTGSLAAGEDVRGSTAHVLAKRVLWAAPPGHLLCSEATAALLRSELSGETRLEHLGLYCLSEVGVRERLFRVRSAELPASPGSPAASHAQLGDAPLHVSRFIGRDQERTRLETLLAAPETRLVTLTGPAGCGKSRLASEIVACATERFLGGVWFVPVAEAADGERFVSRVMDALGVTATPGEPPEEAIVAALTAHTQGLFEGTRALLVVDGVEHLLDAAAPLLARLLARVPPLTCVVTSRRAMELDGETLLGVSPLQIPPSTITDPAKLLEYPSVQLFVDRAQAVRPDFQVTRQTAKAVRELCRRLEGLPLAIELAAQRSQVLTVNQMLEQFDQRFEFLVSRRRDAADRHRTLRAAVDWSHELLSPALQRLFARLSVFRGSWSLAAAEEVCGGPETAEGLMELLVSSLIYTVGGEPEIRFGMLEFLREFAGDKLEENEGSGGSAALRERHARSFLRLAEEAAVRLRAESPLEWVARLDADYENLRAALAWSLERGVRDRAPRLEVGGRIVRGLMEYWRMRGLVREGRSWAEAVLAQVGAADSAQLRACLTHAAGAFALLSGDTTTAQARLEESIRLFRALDEPRELARALADLARLRHERREVAASRAALQEAFDLFRGLDDDHGMEGLLYAMDRLPLHQEARRESAAV